MSRAIEHAHLHKERGCGFINTAPRQYAKQVTLPFPYYIEIALYLPLTLRAILSFSVHWILSKERERHRGKQIIHEYFHNS